MEKSLRTSYFNFISTLFLPYFHFISILFPLYFHPISTNKKAPYHYGAFALFLGDIGDQVDDLVGIAPLVVVPGHYLHKGVG